MSVYVGHNKTLYSILFLIFACSSILCDSNTYEIEKNSKKFNKKYSYSNLRILQESTSVKLNDNIPANNNYEFQVYNIQCNDNNCPDERGQCFNTTTCVCADDYVNLMNEDKDNNDDNNSDNAYCNYKMKKQISAFFLEIIFPIGAGHFYVGKGIIGGFKLFLALMICVFACFTLANKDKANLKLLFAIILGICTLGFFTWHILDIILYGINKYKDSNDIPLSGWS